MVLAAAPLFHTHSSEFPKSVICAFFYFCVLLLPSLLPSLFAICECGAYEIRVCKTVVPILCSFCFSFYFTCNYNFSVFHVCRSLSHIFVQFRNMNNFFLGEMNQFYSQLQTILSIDMFKEMMSSQNFLRSPQLASDEKIEIAHKIAFARIVNKFQRFFTNCTSSACHIPRKVALIHAQHSYLNL